MSDEIEDVVDGLVDEIESEADRLGVASLELADRIKVEIAAKIEMGETT